MSVQINYLWVKGTHLTRTVDTNLQGPETPTVIGLTGTTQTFTYNKITQLRPISGFARIEAFESNSNSFYNGLTVQVRKRFSSITNSWPHILLERLLTTLLIRRP